MKIAMKAVKPVQWRRARVSQKRQVTIPQKFFEQAGIKTEVEFNMKGSNIIMRPVRENVGSDYFADLLLADLLKEGFSGDQLLLEFRKKQAELHVAVENILTESAEAARSFKEIDNEETEKLFSDVMED